MAPLTGPGTAYITPDVLRRAPTGIDWTSIPSRRSSTLEQRAEQANMCLRATGMVNSATNQVLRATLDTEFFSGPDWRGTGQQGSWLGGGMCSPGAIPPGVSLPKTPARSVSPPG